MMTSAKPVEQRPAPVRASPASRGIRSTALLVALCVAVTGAVIAGGAAKGITAQADPRPATAGADAGEWGTLAIGSIAQGSRTGRQSAPSPSVELLTFQPVRSGPALRPVQRPAGQPVAAEIVPLRIMGIVGEDLNVSLRSAGVPDAAAADYLRALATRIDLSGGISVADRFDLVIAHRRSAAGGEYGRLLYAGLDRVGASDLQLLRWTIDRRLDWVDASGSGTQVAGLSWPVPARISSGFGMRLHPLLGFMRFHRGIDLRASWGAPIVAAADGRVASAGWGGGYGKLVQIAHAGGIATSYAHMSRIVATPGQMVRQGQVIGYVGSTGLSSGPHLHYEVSRNGRPVNPVGIGLASSTRVDQRDRDAFRSTMRQFLMLKQVAPLALS